MIEPRSNGVRNGVYMEKKIIAWEPWFFMAFGLFHLHRIWGLIDRNSYAEFWISLVENKDLLYFVLMGILGGLCICIRDKTAK